jgi:ubiquinone/menaquinone biosynthesis C-methylase UbiE
MPDWGIGSYEATAAQLEPVAAVVVDAVEPVAGRTVLDLACGTGNTALEAASRGARVTGMDSSPRLLEVARRRTQSSDLTVAWVEGDFHNLPFEDDSFEILTSTFGVIFATSEDDIAAEIARVLAPAGRLILTTWVDAGAMSRVGRLLRAAIAEKSAAPADEGARFDWGEAVSLTELFANNGLTVRMTTHQFSFRAESPRAMSDSWAEHHPIWLETRAVIGDERYRLLRDDIVEVLESENEDASSMKLTSDYLVVAGSPT